MVEALLQSKAEVDKQDQVQLWGYWYGAESSVGGVVVGVESRETERESR